MALTITQSDVMSALHNLMGHRVTPGGTEEDYERYVQDSFNYCWRYYRWAFSLKTAVIGDDGLLPDDFDYEGYRVFDGVTEVQLADTFSGTAGSALVWDTTENKYKLDPIAETTVTYQYQPPTLGETAVPFPSSMLIAEGATILAKEGSNPTRADIQQEWDKFHAKLDRLAGRADNAKSRRPVHYLDAAGTFVGDVGA